MKSVVRLAQAVRRYPQELRRATQRARRRNERWARALAQRPAMTASLIVTLLIGVSAVAVGLSGLETLDEQEQRRATLRSEIALLEREAGALRGQIAALKDDPAALELLAKTRHQLVESGEVVVLLVESGAAGPGTGADPR